MPVIICGSIALALALVVWLNASLGDRRKLLSNAGMLTALLVITSFFAALPLFFRAAEIGALDALRTLPFCAIAALGALLTAGITNTLRQPRHLHRASSAQSQSNHRSSKTRNPSTASIEKKVTA